jgi:superfamily I DNA/RNA helicase
MIAIDLLFKAYAKAHLAGKANVQLEAKDLSIYSGCNTIFCTASPVLTNEVRRFYGDLNNKIKEYLIKKQKAKLEKMKGKDEPEIVENPKEETKGEEVDDDKETKEAKDMQESIKIALESTKQDLEDEFEEAAQKNIPASVENLQPDNFPCFVTVKKLIYMLDAALGYPFFSRSIDGKIYGMDSSTEWHNENKHGTFMINQYHKDSYDFSKKLKKLGKKVLQAEDIDDEEKLKRLKEEGIEEKDTEAGDIKETAEEDTDSEIDESYDNADIYANMEYMNDQKQAFAGDMKILDQTFSQEVDFEMFQQRFWGKNKGRIKISAMNVWTEIFSVIKGGLQTDWWSFVRRGSYSIMSHSCYMRIKSSMPYLDNREKNQLYWIYVKYEGWKAKNNYYDFMDVVRHVFLYYPVWWKTKIDYLIVDEVQDLTPLTIQLLLSVTNKNVFFCGDTAQTIAKGVGFRFHDLKDIFDNKKVCIPSVIQLTKNYRSHTKILELANTIVDLIEFFFPQTIDKLQRESSDLDGPKPILLEDYTDEDLMAMIIGHSETRNPSFGCNQVVIVRDQETKNTLPIFLKQALCLTVYEAKGLEFDDVILYNFFCDSEATGQYRILKDLEIHTGKRRKIKIETDLTINELDLREFKKRMKKLEEEAKMMDGEEEDEDLIEEYNYLTIDRDTSDILRNFSLLCNDLKHLYVSVTRPIKITDL